MKEMTLEQMDAVQGGDICWSCVNWDGVACGAFGVGLSAAAGALTGGIGAAGMGMAYAMLADCPDALPDSFWGQTGRCAYSPC
jgi:hypothetical protein